MIFLLISKLWFLFILSKTWAENECRDGWTETYDLCVRVMSMDWKVTWYTARQHCQFEAEGADLVVIDSLLIDRAISREESLKDTDKVWIGAINAGDRVWRDVNSKELEYENLSNGPRGIKVSEGEGEMCAHYVPKTTVPWKLNVRLWSYKKCINKMAKFICSYKRFGMKL